MIARDFYPVRDRQAYCLYIQRPLSGRRYTNNFRGSPPEPPSKRKRGYDQEQQQNENGLHPFPRERLRCDQEKS